MTPERVVGSLPPPLLGPLPAAGVRGSWDYRLGFRLDVSRPDSVDFHAEVIPHDLELDPEKSRLNLLGLEQPFVAEIHLPHGRTATRDLSEPELRIAVGGPVADFEVAGEALPSYPTTPPPDRTPARR